MSGARESMDRITRSYLEDFRQEQSLGELADEDTFELFANYCVVSDVYGDEFDVNDIHVGGTGDLGIDGIATVVNGALVTSAEEVEDLVAINGYIDAMFVFVQAKTANNFRGEEMMTFFDGVDEFFEEAPTLLMNDSVESAREVMLKIYENSVRFRHQKPACRLYYVTTGQCQGMTIYRGRSISASIDCARQGCSRTSCALLWELTSCMRAINAARTALQPRSPLQARFCYLTLMVSHKHTLELSRQRSFFVSLLMMAAISASRYSTTTSAISRTTIRLMPRSKRRFAYR
jgi:hypothetical protein